MQHQINLSLPLAVSIFAWYQHLAFLRLPYAIAFGIEKAPDNDLFRKLGLWFFPTDSLSPKARPDCDARHGLFVHEVPQ